MDAITRSKEIVAPYTTKKTGDPIHVHIFLYKGDHFMIDKQYMHYSTEKK